MSPTSTSVLAAHQSGFPFTTGHFNYLIIAMKVCSAYQCSPRNNVSNTNADAGDAGDARESEGRYYYSVDELCSMLTLLLRSLIDPNPLLRNHHPIINTCISTIFAAIRVRSRSIDSVTSNSESGSNDNDKNGASVDGFDIPTVLKVTQTLLTFVDDSTSASSSSAAEGGKGKEKETLPSASEGAEEAEDFYRRVIVRVLEGFTWNCTFTRCVQRQTAATLLKKLLIEHTSTATETTDTSHSNETADSTSTRYPSISNVSIATLNEWLDGSRRFTTAKHNTCPGWFYDVVSLASLLLPSDAQSFQREVDQYERLMKRWKDLERSISAIHAASAKLKDLLGTIDVHLRICFPVKTKNIFAY